MALPTGPASSWFLGTDFPSRLFETGGTDYELYEEDDEFVLSVEMPGFGRDEITLSWDEGVLNIAAEHEDEKRGQRKTYHRRFRFPKTVDDDDISARYKNGILEVRLPVLTGATPRGKQIDIEGRGRPVSVGPSTAAFLLQSRSKPRASQSNDDLPNRIAASPDLL
jgi:HSP20 family protein